MREDVPVRVKAKLKLLASTFHKNQEPQPRLTLHRNRRWGARRRPRRAGRGRRWGSLGTDGGLTGRGPGSPPLPPSAGPAPPPGLREAWVGGGGGRVSPAPGAGLTRGPLAPLGRRRHAPRWEPAAAGALLGPMVALGQRDCSRDLDGAGRGAPALFEPRRGREKASEMLACFAWARWRTPVIPKCWDSRREPPRRDPRPLSFKASFFSQVFPVPACSANFLLLLFCFCFCF
uniref:cDNA FLJ45512 fis, clone BRTHA2021440 n=1 Tax=Homo sapiens TaxID=9606 RepID=Q6ZSI0_HUMAN|nr:unnamed protein product [Homo sapiens]